MDKQSIGLSLSASQKHEAMSRIIRQRKVHAGKRRMPHGGWKRFYGSTPLSYPQNMKGKCDSQIARCATVNRRVIAALAIRTQRLNGTL